jgi:hypothetical protein
MTHESNAVTRTWLAFAMYVGLGAQLSAAPATLMQVTSFADLDYGSGFTGEVGVTSEWPAEMGRQGDTIDVGFLLTEAPPATARHYRFRMVIGSHFDQSFPVSILAGPSRDELGTAHTEFVDSTRVLAATIPLGRFMVGQTNWVRIQGSGVEVGDGKPAGIQWTRWLLTRTDTALDLPSAVDDQLARAMAYVQAAIQPNGMVRDSLTLSPSTPPFHPASPDAAGFALLALCAMDHLGLSTNAEAQAQAVLSAYAGHTPGVTPARNIKGHWWHWLRLSNGTPEPGWVDNYTTIGSGLLVAGALFARNHFTQNPTIAAYAEEMHASCDFDSMIHPALDGRIALATDANGNAVGYTRPWNEYMLVVSLALRQRQAVHAPAVSNLWLNAASAPKAVYRGLPTLTDRAGAFAPAFWVQQQYYFNPDFAADPGFVGHLKSHQRADALYCALELAQNYRYGLTAGVSPSGYRADRIYDQEFVFSPEAVGAWGDLDTLLEFAQDQPPGSDPRSRYGLTRVSSVAPAWWPADAGLVDHLFLMLGLVEARNPQFFKERQSLEPAPLGPTLNVVPQPSSQVTLSWTPDAPDFALQETTVLSPTDWTDSPSGASNPVTLPTTGSARFFRLIKSQGGGASDLGDGGGLPGRVRE